MEYQNMSNALRKVAADAHDANKGNFERQRDMIDELFAGVHASMVNQQERLVELIEHFDDKSDPSDYNDIPATHDGVDVDGNTTSADPTVGTGGGGMEGVPDVPTVDDDLGRDVHEGQYSI